MGTVGDGRSVAAFWPLARREKGLKVINGTVERTKGGYAWYLVMTKRGKETLAKANLERQGVTVYLPMFQPKMRTTSDRKGWVAAPRPFLPGYLFVSVDTQGGQWRSINSTLGVSGIYTTGHGEAQRPRALQNAWIEQLQAREQFGLIVLPPAEEVKRVALEPGAPLTIRRGHADLNVLFLEQVDARACAARPSP